MRSIFGLIFLVLICIFVISSVNGDRPTGQVIVERDSRGKMTNCWLHEIGTPPPSGYTARKQNDVFVVMRHDWDDTLRRHNLTREMCRLATPGR